MRDAADAVGAGGAHAELRARAGDVAARVGVRVDVGGAGPCGAVELHGLPGAAREGGDGVGVAVGGAGPRAPVPARDLAVGAGERGEGVAVDIAAPAHGPEARDLACGAEQGREQVVVRPVGKAGRDAGERRPGVGVGERREARSCLDEGGDDDAVEGGALQGLRVSCERGVGGPRRGAEADAGHLGVGLDGDAEPDVVSNGEDVERNGVRLPEVDREEAVGEVDDLGLEPDGVRREVVVVEREADGEGLVDRVAVGVVQRALHRQARRRGGREGGQPQDGEGGEQGSEGIHGRHRGSRQAVVPRRSTKRSEAMGGAGGGPAVERSRT